MWTSAPRNANSLEAWPFNSLARCCWRLFGVECVKFRKLIMGSGEAIPSEPPSLASPGQGERGGGEGVASIPLVDLSEPQAAVFNLSRCTSFRNAMLR